MQESGSPATTKKKDVEDQRPKTPVFFENFAPPKKESMKKKFGKKKSQGAAGENCNLLKSILHSQEPVKKNSPTKKKGLKDSSKKSTSGSGMKKKARGAMSHISSLKGSFKKS